MRVDEASRWIAAPPGRVFRAFTDPGELLGWLPPEGMTARLERFDDSGYRMVLTYDERPEGGGKATDDSDIAEVRRIRIDPPHRLVEAVDFPSDDPAFSGTMIMTWTFVAEREGTVVTISASDVPSGIDPGVHVGALESSLAQLAAAVEPQASRSDRATSARASAEW